MNYLLNATILFVLLILVVYVLFFKIKQATLVGKWYYIFFSAVHFSITAFFAFFLDKFTTINDPQRFYKIAFDSDSWLVLLGFGNRFMAFLAYPFAKLGFTLPTCFFLFSFVGWLGFLKLFSLLNFKNLKKLHFYHFYFFLPSLHLWTSSLSKEPLLLFLIATVLSLVSDIKKLNYWKLVGVSVLILLIRPHVFFVMGLSFSLVYHFKIQKISYKLLIPGLMITILIGAVVIVKFLQVDTFSPIELKEQLVARFIKESQKGNTAISLTNTTIFERILYLLYMPLPFLHKPQSVFQFLALLENLYYVLVTVFILIKISKMFRFVPNKALPFSSVYALVNLLFMILLFGSYIYNQGLANRMRIMIYPFLFFYLIQNLNLKTSLNAFDEKLNDLRNG